MHGRNYKPVPRNKADSEKAVSMLLKSRETGHVGRLSFPDLSGEAFRSQWTERELPISYDRSLRDATGGVLFVHPDNIIKPFRIDTVNAVLENIGALMTGKRRRRPKAKLGIEKDLRRKCNWWMCCSL